MSDPSDYDDAGENWEPLDMDTTGGSQAPEAEALLKGQPHEAEATLNPERPDSLADAIGGDVSPVSDSARTQSPGVGAGAWHQRGDSDADRDRPSVRRRNAAEALDVANPTGEVGGSDTARLPPCAGCAAGLPVLMLDEDGTRTDISRRPGVPSHAVSDAWWACPRWIPATLTQPADTARLQQKGALELFSELEFALYGKRDNTWEAKRCERVMTVLLKFVGDRDAQALAIRTVQQERDAWKQQFYASEDNFIDADEAWDCSESENATLRADVARLRDVNSGLVSGVAEAAALRKIEIASLQADVARLTAWKEEAVEALAQSNVLHDALVNRPQYIGWNVHKAAVHALSHAEQQVIALREGIEQLRQAFATLQAAQFAIFGPVTIVHSGRCGEELNAFYQAVSALLAAIKET